MRAMDVRQPRSHMQSDAGRFSPLGSRSGQLATELKASGEGGTSLWDKGLFSGDTVAGQSLSMAVALEVLTRLILGLCGGEVVFQEALQILKGGTLLGVLFPTVDHELMQRDGAVLRAGHPVATLHLFQHLPVVHACKDSGHESGHLPAG